MGIGAWENFGLPRMLRDLNLIDAAWFYNWRSALPEVAIHGWALGEDASLGGISDDPNVVLGSGGADAWVFQTVPVAGARSYDLFLSATGPASPRGGLAITFADGDGRVLGKRLATLSGGTGPARLRDVVAPRDAVAAQITVWQSAGEGLALDDVMVVANGTNVVLNGDFDIWRRVGGTLPEFVPRIWGRDDVTAEKLAEAAGAGVVLGFNQPDHLAQSNMTVSEAIELWPKLVSTGIRLGSPATTPSGTLGADYKTGCHSTPGPHRLRRR